jgi:hypothetical protein
VKNGSDSNSGDSSLLFLDSDPILSTPLVLELVEILVNCGGEFW